LVQLGFHSGPETILFLKHDPNAKRTPHSFAGLYHYAVLVPNRKSLASTYLASAIEELSTKGSLTTASAKHYTCMILKETESRSIQTDHAVFGQTGTI